MARRKGIRKSADNNVPGMPGSTPFRPTNGGGPGMRDPRSAGQDGQGFFFGGPGGQHNPGSGQARPQDIPQKGEPGMSYRGGTPGFYDKGGPGFGGQPFPGGSNGSGDNLPGFGGQFPGAGGENTIGMHEYYGGGPGVTPGPGGRPGPGKRPPRGGGRPQRPPGRGMPSGGPGLRRPEMPGMNIPNDPRMNIKPTFNGPNGDMNYTNR